MFAYGIRRFDGFVYVQGRKFVEPDDKVKPILYSQPNHASNALTLIAQEDYVRQAREKKEDSVYPYWWKLSDNEKEEMRNKWAVVRYRLVEEPDGTVR